MKYFVEPLKIKLYIFLKTEDVLKLGGFLMFVTENSTVEEVVVDDERVIVAVKVVPLTEHAVEDDVGLFIKQVYPPVVLNTISEGNYIET